MMVEHNVPPPPQRPAEPSIRQKRFLRVAYNSLSEFAAKHGDRWHKSAFVVSDVAEECGFPPIESRDICTILYRDFGFISPNTDHTSSAEPFIHAELTELGRDYARQLIEEDAAKRREKVWRIVKAAWAIGISLAVAIGAAWANRRFERLEKLSQPSSPAAAEHAQK